MIYSISNFVDLSDCLKTVVRHVSFRGRISPGVVAPIGENLRHALKLAGIDGSKGPQETASTSAIEAVKGAYAIDGNQAVSSLKIAGFGPAKKKPLIDLGYTTVEEVRKLSLYDLQQAGLSSGAAETFYSEIHQREDE